MTSKVEVKISDLNCRVVLCTMQDIVEQDGQMALRRQEVARIWASIKVSSISFASAMSFMSAQGYASVDNPDRVTHKIVIRRQSYLDVTSAAWIYEERRITAPRWYKVLGFYYWEGNWIVIPVHLQERSDQAQPPQSDLRARPSKVSL